MHLNYTLNAKLTSKQHFILAQK